MHIFLRYVFVILKSNPVKKKIKKKKQSVNTVEYPIFAFNEFFIATDMPLSLRYAQFLKTPFKLFV